MQRLAEIKSQLKESSYTLYKLPNNTVVLGFADDRSISNSYGNIIMPNHRLYEDLKIQYEHIFEMYKLGKNDFIIVDNNSKDIYVDKIDNILNKYVDANTNEDIDLNLLISRMKKISHLFDIYYYDNNGDDYILDGLKIKIKDTLCGVRHKVELIKTEYNKLMAIVDNTTTYDMNRFLSEFDKRTIPRFVSDYIETRDYSYIIKEIEFLLDKSIVKLGVSFKNYLDLIDNVIKVRYNTSILKAYLVEMPTLDKSNGILTYHFGAEDIKFKIGCKNGELSMSYLDNNKQQTIISKCTPDKFYKQFITMMGLENKNKLQLFSSSYTHNLGKKIIEDYKYSSGDFNKTIDSISKNNINNIDIKNYIDAVYLYNLISKCKLRENIVMFRGKVSSTDCNRISFKSLSLALPVALRHSSFNTQDLGIIKCVKNTSILLSNADLIFSDELEGILNANFVLKQTSNNIFITESKKVNIHKIDSVLVDLCESIISNNKITYHMYIHDVVNNTIKVRGYYSNIELNIKVLKDKVILSSGSSKIEVNIDDYVYENVTNIIWKFIMTNIENGMKYDCNRGTYRNLAINIQYIMNSLGMKYVLEFNPRGAAIFKFGNDTLTIYESTGIYIKHNNNNLISVPLERFDFYGTLANLRNYLIKNINFDYTEYFKYLTNIIKGKYNCEVLDGGLNKVAIKTPNKNVRLDGKNNIYWIKNKSDNKIIFTFEPNKDAYKLYELIRI